jgi:phospholipid transport system substrate-binding protein
MRKLFQARRLCCNLTGICPSRHRFAGRLVRLAIICAALQYVVLPANAGPASDLIAKLNTVFIDIMQNAEALGYKGRYEKLEPALVEAYDFAEMTRVTTGRYWRGFTDDQKRQVIAAFHDLSVATYAARFNGFGGERFEILGEEPAPSGSLRVNNQIVPTGRAPIRIDYMMRQTDGQWRIVDVYLKSTVSELAVRRAEFTGILAKSGFDGLIAELKAKVAKLRNE